jgi:hypothetical protein
MVDPVPDAVDPTDNGVDLAVERWIRAEAARGAAGERESGATGEGVGATVWECGWGVWISERGWVGRRRGYMSSTQLRPNLGRPKFAGLFSSKCKTKAETLFNSAFLGQTKQGLRLKIERRFRYRSKHCNW